MTKARDDLRRGTVSVDWPMALMAGWLARKPSDRRCSAECRPLMIRIQLRAFVTDDWHRWPLVFVTGDSHRHSRRAAMAECRHSPRVFGMSDLLRCPQRLALADWRWRQQPAG